MYPELLLAQAKQIHATDLLLEGCAKEYINALATGRLEAWAKMAHSIVDLLATDSWPKRHRREDLEKQT